MQVRSPKTLSDNVVKILTDRLRDEYVAHFFYRNATNWCAGRSYVKAAAFFADEAKTELKHANGIQKYLVDWNVVPLMPSVKPNIMFTDLVDIINKAYALEYGLWESYCADSKTMFDMDINTFDFLTGYREIQNQSVIEYSDLLNAAMLVDVDKPFELLYFEQTYFQV